MDQTLDQIEAHIDRARARLGSNLRELEGKVEAATDVRAQFQARPFVMLGAACAGGLVLAAALRPRRGSPRPVVPRRGFDGRRQLADAWDDIATALVGVASAALKDYIGELVPGFQEHVTRASQRAASH